MIAIDTNALILLIIGSIDPKIIENHKRTSIYDLEDYQFLTEVIGDYNRLVVLPNIWTEVDNLLNNFIGRQKELYIENMKILTKELSEEYLISHEATENYAFFDLGLTDTQILILSQKCECLITADSRLSDYAISFGVKIVDLVKRKNEIING